MPTGTVGEAQPGRESGMGRAGNGTPRRGCLGAPTSRGGARRTPQAGFTLAEVALATTVLLVALMAISAATFRSHTLRQQNRETTLANNAVRSMSECVHARSREASIDPPNWATDLAAVFEPGGAIGNTFEARGLNEVDGSTPVGTLSIITDETSTDSELGVEMGMPRDLNGDGDALDSDVSNSAHLLPVNTT